MFLCLKVENAGTLVCLNLNWPSGGAGGNAPRRATLVVIDDANDVPIRVCLNNNVNACLPSKMRTEPPIQHLPIQRAATTVFLKSSPSCCNFLVAFTVSSDDRRDNNLNDRRIHRSQGCSLVHRLWWRLCYISWQVEVRLVQDSERFFVVIFELLGKVILMGNGRWGQWFKGIFFAFVSEVNG